MDNEENEYDAYVFYQLLEEQTTPAHTLVEDIKVTPDIAKVGQLFVGINWLIGRQTTPAHNLEDGTKVKISYNG